MSSTAFTHLHLHSQYSLLDGAIHMDALCPTVKELGMDTVAVTDHGNMFGAVHLAQQAKKHGVKPIFGVEAYVAGDKGRKDRTDRQSSHLVLLAKDLEGYKNLTYLVSMAYMEGFYYKPRIDRDLLKRHAKGIYGLSACLGGVVNKPLLTQGEPAAAAIAKEYKDLFEKDHFFLELQDNGLTPQPKANAALLNIGEIYDIPMVATADAHYRKPEDAVAHEILMCIGQGMSLDEFRKKSYEHSKKLYVRSPAQMHEAFANIAPQAVDNTMRIANHCNVDLDLSQTHLPSFNVPQGMTRELYFEQLVTCGLRQRIEQAPYSIDEAAYKQRLDYELGVILKMGFASYFLIVWDFIRFAKEQGIPVGPGRGSGAGSLVAWCLGITDLDPIPYGLIFERFLNPDRVSMPDFDIDFCMHRRSEVIDYVANKYGKDNVAQIVTYSQLSAKSGIKDVGRVMQLPFAEVNELTKLIPGLIDGKKVSIDQALKLEPKLRDIQKEKPAYKEVIDIGRALEGLNRNTGIHAAGIVIGDKPIWEYVPVCRGKEGEMVTQFAKDEVEAAGLVKFDFLGLKTLTVIDQAVKHVRNRPGNGPVGKNAEFNVELLPLTDPKVYAMMTTADTDGVFQLESSGFKDLLKRLQPECFEEIVAAVALYRPGPLDAGMVDDYVDRKNGKHKVVYPHAVCESILKPTYGVIVYQEQVMRIAVDLCGFTMGEADILRKAMGKKKADVMAKMRAQFVDGAHATNGMEKKSADQLFSQIEKFAGYAFNKSHSAAYAVISYRTGFLKRYYPVEFMAALLSTEMRTQENVVRYIQSARDSGIRILPPDVMQSGRDFSVVQHSETQGEKPTWCILFGLGAVKGIGDAAIESILRVRKDIAQPASIYSFCEAVDLKKVNRRVIDALIKSGAFDCFDVSRAKMAAVVNSALERGQKAQRDRASGQTSFFDAMGRVPAGDQSTGEGGERENESYPPIDDWSEKQKLCQEKEALGFYITGHPLDRYLADLNRLTSVTTASLPTFAGQSQHRFTEIAIAGIVAGYRERPLKSGKGRMAFVTLEDLHGTCEILVFSKVYAECSEILRADDPLLIRGNVMLEGEDGGIVKVRASSVTLLADARTQATTHLEMSIPVFAINDSKLMLLKEILGEHRGTVPTHLTVVQPNQFQAVIAMPEHLRVNPSDELLTRVDNLFGQKVVRLS